MNDKQGPATAEQILDRLPPPLSAKTLRSRYGASMAYARTIVHEAFTRPSAADVAVAAVRSAGTTLLRLVNHAADVVADALQPAPAFAYATRSLGSGAARPDGAPCVRVSRESDSCRLVASIEAAGEGQDVRVRLEDESGARLSPMTLTVGDAESGKALLSEKAFASGEALLRGVEPGSYAVAAECGDRSVAMTIRIEGPSN
jgi:hypothetical protein